MQRSCTRRFVARTPTRRVASLGVEETPPGCGCGEMAPGACSTGTVIITLIQACRDRLHDKPMLLTKAGVVGRGRPAAAFYSERSQQNAMSLTRHTNSRGASTITRALRHLVVVTALAGCRAPASRAPEQLSASHVSALADLVAEIARASERAWKDVSCANLEPALRYWDGSAPGLIHASEGAMRVLSDQVWADYVRSGVCSSGAGEGTVDSVLVAVLSPDFATATMRFHADLRDSAGVVKPIHGQILRVFHRTAEGWKIRIRMSTHLPRDGTRQ